jgi:hypothetical protein
MNDSRVNDSNEDDNIEKRLYLALDGQRDTILACPRDPSPLQPSEPLQDQIYQQDNNDQIGRDMLKGLTCPVLNNAEEDSKGQKLQQHQKEEVVVELEEQDSNSSNSSEIDDSNRVVDDSKNSSDQDIDQDSNESKNPRFAERRRSSPTLRDYTLRHS